MNPSSPVRSSSTLQMVCNEHLLSEWARLAAAAYKAGHTLIGDKFSTARTCPAGSMIPLPEFDRLQEVYRAWLVFGWDDALKAFAEHFPTSSVPQQDIDLTSPESALAYLRSLPTEAAISLPGFGEPPTTEGDAVAAACGEDVNHWARLANRWDWTAGELVVALSPSVPAITPKSPYWAACCDCDWPTARRIAAEYGPEHVAAVKLAEQMADEESDSAE